MSLKLKINIGKLTVQLKSGNDSDGLDRLESDLSSSENEDCKDEMEGDFYTIKSLLF